MVVTASHFNSLMRNIYYGAIDQNSAGSLYGHQYDDLLPHSTEGEKVSATWPCVSEKAPSMMAWLSVHMPLRHRPTVAPRTAWALSPANTVWQGRTLSELLPLAAGWQQSLLNLVEQHSSDDNGEYNWALP
jgi:hypothetical protein